MIRRTAIGLISAALILSGILSARKLHYWERSIRIFRTNIAEMRFEGRGRGGSGRFEGRPDRMPDGSFRDRSYRFEGNPSREREDAFRALPDSVRRSFESELRERRSRGEFSADTMARRPERFDRERMGRAPYESGLRDRDGRGREDFRRGRAVRLRNVRWFLAVFAAFTVLAIYADRAILQVRRWRKRLRPPNYS